MLSYKNQSEKLNQLRDGSLSLAENVKFFLKRIEDEKDINAFISVFENESLERAESIQQKINNGSAGKLAGMVIAVKDVISVKDHPMTSASKVLENFSPLYTATSIQNLINEDAIIIGKTNCDEYAMGSSNENSAFGVVKNPFDKTRVPGGSSGGSAAATAAWMCDAAIGTDTGGSIRQPAAFCGLFGLKPTYGRISRFGLTAFASSFDSIGTFTRNADDASLLFSILKSEDEFDSTSIAKSESVADKRENDKFTFGLPIEFFEGEIDGEIKIAIEKYITELKSSGHNVKEISLPHSKYSIATYYILTTAEASANLARYEGVRYGKREKTSSDFKAMFENFRTEKFGAEVKRRIMLGTYVLSSGYYDAYYLRAQKARRLIKNDFDRVFDEVDFILSPTTPTLPFKIGEKVSDPLQMYLSDIFTTSANLAGIPAINIPIGFSKDQLPIGLQLMANQFEEEKMFKFLFN